MQEKALEALRQLVMEDLLNRIYDYTLIEKQCLAGIDNQAEPARKKELNDVLKQVTSDLKGMIDKSCRYRAANYYSPAKLQE